MDKQPVGTLPDLTASSLDDEIMIITDSERSTLQKEKISDLITDFTSTDENNALTKGTDGKMFVTDFGNASNITEGTLPVSVLPDIPKDLLPAIETSDLPVSGVTADTYAYPSSVTVNAQGQVTAIEEGSPSGANANTDLSNITDAGKEVIRETAGTDYQLTQNQITNCILEAPNGVATYSGNTITIKQGLKVLIPNGRNADRTLNNIVYTVEEDITVPTVSALNEPRYLFLLSNGTGTNNSIYDLYISSEQPTVSNARTTLWYNPETNLYQLRASGTSTFNTVYYCLIAQYGWNGSTITSFNTYQPVELLKRTDKAEITGWGFPSDKYDDLEYGLNGDVYNAPDNGIFCLGFRHPNNTNVTQYAVDVLDENENFLYNVCDVKNISNQDTYVISPIKKGHKLRVYNSNFTVVRFRFIYAEGVSND